MRTLVLLAFAAGVVCAAGGSLWVRDASAHYVFTYLQSSAFGHYDPYGTHFAAKSEIRYSSYPETGPGIVHAYRSYLHMDILNTPTSSYYLDCSIAKLKWNIGHGSSTSGENYWDGAPFPLTYNNTPYWDYTTWEGSTGVANGGRNDGNYTDDIEFYYSASRKSVCQVSGGDSDGVLTNYNLLPYNVWEIDPDPYTR